jgi:iron complex transport system substrate-binding protein
MKIAALPAFIALLGLSLVSLPANAEPGKVMKAGPSSQPPRIVAAGGVITEIVYALGRPELLVGVDATSRYPDSALRDKPNVGYVRALSSEGLLSLKPTDVIAIDSAGPPDILKAVAEAGVKVSRIPEIATPAGISEKINAIAALIGEKDKGTALAIETKKEFKALESLRAKIDKPRRALFILSFQNGRAMVGGRNTPADGIMTLAGLQNAARAIDGWKPISDEALLESAPDIIIAMDHGPQTVTLDSILAVPAFAATPAAKSKSVLIFDGEYLLGFGPRTPHAARDLMFAAYPEQSRPSETSGSR